MISDSASTCAHHARNINKTITVINGIHPPQIPVFHIDNQPPIMNISSPRHHVTTVSDVTSDTST